MSFVESGNAGAGAGPGPDAVAPVIVTRSAADRPLSTTVPFSTTNVTSSREWLPAAICGMRLLQAKGALAPPQDTSPSSARLPSTYAA